MAITNTLKKTDPLNDYGFEFKQAYFKIENLRIDTRQSSVRIELRGYANPGAREEQKRRDEDVNDPKKDVNGSNVINVIGIYKEVIHCNMSDLKVKSFSINDILAAGYVYLKTLKRFVKGSDV